MSAIKHFAHPPPIEATYVASEHHVSSHCTSLQRLIFPKRRRNICFSASFPDAGRSRVGIGDITLWSLFHSSLLLPWEGELSPNKPVASLNVQHLLVSFLQSPSLVPEAQGA